MNREYVVEKRFCVFRIVTTDYGVVVKKDLTDVFSDRTEAEAKAKIGNYIQKKAAEQFCAIAGGVK
jgi:hypothetical protein